MQRLGDEGAEIKWRGLDRVSKILSCRRETYLIRWQDSCYNIPRVSRNVDPYSGNLLVKNPFFKVIYIISM